jgi:hypothetical protein
MPGFEDQAQNIVSVAAQIARAQNVEPDATVLENASPSLILSGYDDEGSPYYALTLEIPIQTYVQIEHSRDSVEKLILNRIRPIIRRYPGSWVSEVIVTPVLSTPALPSPLPAEGREQTEELVSFWQTGFFRLFISHTHSNKTSAHNLKSALANYPIAAFVAHDDIEPTKEWQAEIERALRTTDAMAAVISPDFIESHWCDQEVGFAFGRGKLVIPLCKESVPHGFLGKYQGFQAKGLDTSDVAEQLFQILLSHELTAERLADALVDNVAHAGSFKSAKSAMSLLERVPHLTQTQVARLVQSITDNKQVGDAIGVPERIRALVARFG